MRAKILVKRVATVFLVAICFVCLGIGISFNFEGDVVADEVDTKIEIIACNLSFQDSVKIMYAVDSENIEVKNDIKVLVWETPQKEYIIENANLENDGYVLSMKRIENIEGKDYAVFLNNNVYAKQMADDFYAVPYYDDNGRAIYGNIVKYSIIQYAKNMKGSKNSTSELDDLITDMLQYGVSTQKYFKYNLDRLANSKYYQLEVVGGKLDDGFSSGLYQENEQITITTDNSNFACWLDEDNEVISEDKTFTYKVTCDSKVILKEKIPTFDLEFTEIKNGTEYEVSGIGTCTDTEIIISSEYKGKPVTSIGESAFFGCSLIISVEIPNSVESIGGHAFYGCSSITEFIIPNSVESIGSYAFGYCSSLIKVTIPNSVESIGWQAFDCCSNLQFNEYDNSLYLGNSENKYLWLIKVKNTLISSCFISDNCKHIADYTFYYCSSLISVTIPNSVTSIGSVAFGYCDNLTSIIIPNSVTSIGSSAFGYCDNLVNVIFEENSKCKSIENSAFRGCSSLVNIKIPNSVESIGSYVFESCGNLTEVTFEENSKCESIGNGAFERCSSLTEVIIPNSVTILGKKAFIWCNLLKSAVLSESLNEITSGLFWYCTSLESIVIPDSVISIEESAFDSCLSLKYVVIGDSVKNIDFAAFECCESLEYVILPKSIETLDYGAFYQCYNVKKVYYKGTEADWNEINVADLNYRLTSVTRYYYVEIEPQEAGNYWHYDTDGVTIIEW